MQWLSIKDRDGMVNKYAVRSACGQYTACKVVVFGRSYFEAWHGKDRIGVSLSPELAKDLCQHHANQMEFA